MFRRAGRGALVLVALLLGASASTDPGHREAYPPRRPGEVIVKFRQSADGIERATILSELGASPTRQLAGIDAALTTISAMSVDRAIERFRDHPSIEYIEPNYILRAAEIPNDPSFEQQWGLNNTGQTGGTPGADIHATSAWDVTTDSKDVIVAIIDTGIDLIHEDLSPNIFVNSQEIASNGIDDDENGFVDDIFGWDFVFGDNDPSDDNGHGTHVAGTVGAIGNNGVGGAGVAWNVKLLPLKFLGPDGTGTTGAAVDAIDYAIQMGADIINASWGGPGGGQALRDAVERANDAGVLIVAAAGNSPIPVNIDASPYFPASLGTANIIAVAASDHNDQLWGNSNFGPVSVDLVAPGVNILSSWPGDSYAFLNGTSMATPHVSGTLALMEGRFPDISVPDAKALLLGSVDRLPELDGVVSSAGRLNAFVPVSDPDTTAPGMIEDLITEQTDSTRIDLAWTATGDDGYDGTASRYDLRYSTETIDEDSFRLATRVDGEPDPLPAGNRQTIRITGLEPSTTYFFAIRVWDEFGNRSPLSNVAVGTTSGPPRITITPESFDAELLTGQQTVRTLTLRNDGDGEYLFETSAIQFTTFTDRPLPPMVARPVVNPVAPAPITSGPLYGPPSTRSSGNGSDSLGPAGQDGSGGFRMLLLHSGADVTEIRAALSGFPDIGVVEVFEGQQATPTLEVLATYDSVVVIANSPFGDSFTVGNALADYVDQGGGLVMMLATFIQGWQIGGRYASGGYSPFEIGTGPVGGSVLGEFDAGHPIFNGVESARGDLLGSVNAANGARVVGYWENGQPIVAVNNLDVAALNIYVAGTGFWGGDVPLIIRNAAFFTSNVVSWLSSSPATGVVPAGETLELEVLIDAAGLTGGDYDANLVLTGNDPDRHKILVPTHLRVSGAPDIVLSPLALDFGTLFVGDSASASFKVINQGAETLSVTGFAFDHPDFSSSSTPFMLSPTEEHLVEVTWQPTIEGPVHAVLSVLNNDPDNGAAPLALDGISLNPPDISVSPPTIFDQLFSGDTSTSFLTIANDGGSDLIFDLSIQTTISPAFLDDDMQLGLPTLGDSAEASTEDPPFVFTDDFEDGNLEDWTLRISQNLKSVTDETAANGTNFSYHQINLQAGHFNGIFTEFGGVQPGYASFWIRSSSSETNDAYFILRDQNQNEAIFFFAQENGFLYANLDVGGDASVPYEANTWYFIEIRNIDFETRTFDYWVDDTEIKTAIPFRFGQTSKSIQRLELYNFDNESEAWWDEVVVADAPPSEPFRVNPSDGVVPAGEQLEIAVTFDSRGLAAGDHFSNIVIESNDPDEPLVLIPALLNVIGAPDIDLPEGPPEFGTVFIGASSTQTLLVANAGTDTLHIRDVLVDHPDYSVDSTAFDIESGASADLRITFTPSGVGARDATLTLFSDDPDETELAVTLRGAGALPPVIKVTPTSIAEELFTGQSVERTLTLENLGESDLTFVIDVEDEGTASTSPAHGFVQPLSTSVVGAGFEFFDDFEDGDFDGWQSHGGSGNKEVTDDTGADRTRFSYHESASAGGHFTGIFQQIPTAQPGYVSAWVRPGSTTQSDSYVVLRGADGADAIFFFASRSGQFEINVDVGGDASVEYTALDWYHIEFRNIDFEFSRFDYWVNGEIVQTRIPFRNASVIQNFARLEFYNFTRGSEAWWDEVVISDTAPLEPVSVSPESGVIPPGGRVDATVLLDASGFGTGVQPFTIAIESDDPLAPRTTVSVELIVEGAPDIELSENRLDFGEQFVGASSALAFRAINEGTEILIVSGVSIASADFEVDPSGFTLEPRQRRDIAVTFRPSVSGNLTALLEITSNDPDEASTALPLSGIGVIPPDINVTPSALNAGLRTGGSSIQALRIENLGQFELQFVIRFPGDDEPPPWLSVSAMAGSVPPGGVQTLGVVFDATSLGDAVLESTVRILSNDPDEPEVQIPVSLTVEAAPIIEVTPEALDFGTTFVNTTGERTLIVDNPGAATLEVSSIQSDDSEFVPDSASLTVPAGESAELLVRFTPLDFGDRNGVLTLTSNSPSRPTFDLPLTGFGASPPRAEVSPESFSETLVAGEIRTRVLTIANPATSPLTFEVVVDGGAVDPSETFGIVAPNAPSPINGPSAPGSSAADSSILFRDGFEEGELAESWSIVNTTGLKEVTNKTAADETRFSYHEFESELGHVNGIFQEIGAIQPDYIGFWVRSGSTLTDDGYFVLRDHTGLEVIWFFCNSDGNLFVNAESGGDATFRYTANTWYHIEFKNIDFATQRFDYYVNSSRIKRLVQFRNFGAIDDVSRLDLYNFSEFSEAHWDEIVLATEEPFRSVRVRPRTGVVAAQGSIDLNVTFDSRTLIHGDYEAEILVLSDAPDRPEITIPVDLSVIGTPAIGTSVNSLDFGVVQVGLPQIRSVTVTNFGTKTLEVTDVAITGEGFRGNTGPFSLVPDLSRGITITFDPEIEGAVSGTLTLTSNDPDDGEVVVTLSAVAAIPPMALIDPVVLHAEQFERELTTRTLTIENGGGQPLSFSVAARTLQELPVSTEIVAYLDDFEGTIENWNTESLGPDDLWHRTQRDSNSPKSSFWCGDETTGHYATPNRISNALITPPLDLRNLVAPVTLSFMEKYLTEPVWDECLVDLSTDGGETWIALRGEYGEAPSGDSGGWVIENLTLSDYVGQIVQVRFYFETFDSANNALPGWFIDDVRIGAQGTPWVSVFPEEGIAEPGETAEVLVTFDSLEYRPSGDYEALIRVETNDPFGPRTEIPTTLRIHDTPRLILPGEPVTEESTLEFSGATTHHELLLSTPPAGGGEVRLEVQGDFTRPGKTATAVAEFVPLGTLGGSSGATEENCGTVAMLFPIDGDTLRTLVTDGRLEVDFRNSDGVTLSCPTNVHAAQLTYRAARQAVDFGQNPAGSPTVQLLRIKNDGDGALRIDSVTTDAPSVTIVPTDLTLAPRASVDLELTWTPDAASELSHELRIVSNDPENPLATLNLKGSATDPLGRIELTPQEIVAALPPGSDLVKLKVVQLSNTGEGDLSWRAEPNAWTSVQPDTGTILPGGFVEIELRFTSLALDSGDYEDVIAISSNDPVNPRIELPVTLHVEQVELTSFSVNLSPKFAERPGTVEVSFQAPDGFDISAVDVSTVSIDGVFADASPIVYRDMDQDGRDDIVLQFDRAALVAALPTGSPILITLSGELRDLAWFEGSVYIRGVAEIGSD